MQSAVDREALHGFLEESKDSLQGMLHRAFDEAEEAALTATVVKVFGRGYAQFRDIPGIYGYTILGNEDVVLIADLRKFAEQGGENMTQPS